MIRPNNWKNWLAISDDPVTDTDHFSTSLTIAEYGILGDLFAFLKSPADFHDTQQNDWSWQGNGFGNYLPDIV